MCPRSKRRDEAYSFRSFCSLLPAIHESAGSYRKGSLPLGRITLSLARNRLVQQKGGRKGDVVGVGSRVGLTGFVDSRYCRYRSVELVYPCVDARSWSRWPTRRNRIQGCPVTGRRTCNRRPILLFRDGDDNALPRRVVASLRPP